MVLVLEVFGGGKENGGCTIWIDGMYGGEGFSKLFFPEVLVTFEGGRGQE